MCTALSMTAGAHYFGRNLDLAYSYNEAVTVTPRRFPLPLHGGGTLRTHHAMIGMAFVQDGYPLYYDAVNEKGLGAAGLRFAASAVYLPPEAGKENVAPFEFIPWLLGQCADLAEAKALLENANIEDAHFSAALPNTPLHWFVADRTGALAVEQTAEGFAVHDDAAGVLTNEPPFPTQMWNLSRYMGLNSTRPQNRIAPGVPLRPDSGGMGAVGLPGDLSSASRFVRAVFTKENSACGDSPSSALSRFFRVLDAVSYTKGCLREEEGLAHTVYSACCDTDAGVYYYKTYENSRIAAVDMRKEDLDGDALISYPLRRDEQDILFHN